MGEASKEIFRRTEKESLSGKIEEVVTLIKFIEGIEISPEDKTLYNLDAVDLTLSQLNQESVENLSKIRLYLEDQEMKEIIKVNEYRKGDSDEDIVGNFLGFVLPALRRITRKGISLPKDQEFLDLIDKKTRDFIEYLNY